MNGTLRGIGFPDIGPQSCAVELKIEDDGPGICPDDMLRIFEPFFTTKKDVGPNLLGLWVAKDAERHGGNIRVQSPSGNGSHGCVFTVVIPCGEQVLAAEAG